MVNMCSSACYPEIAPDVQSTRCRPEEVSMRRRSFDFAWQPSEKDFPWSIYGNTVSKMFEGVKNENLLCILHLEAKKKKPTQTVIPAANTDQTAIM